MNKNLHHQKCLVGNRGPPVVVVEVLVVEVEVVEEVVVDLISMQDGEEMLAPVVVVVVAEETSVMSPFEN